MHRLFPALVFPGCLAFLLIVSFGAALFGDGQFAYRDSGEFYYPLYERVQEEWRAGRWPLWEPGENGGMPILGNPTAAVLYPGKLIYSAFPYPWAARFYVVAHLVLAVVAMFAMMRSWGASVTGSALAALSYGFSGPILFLYCNIIFLVGAAWLPLGFRATDRWLRLGRRGAPLELAAVIALQTLGGDPEAAYVLGLCAVGYALGLAGDDWRPTRSRLLWAPILATVWIAATLLLAVWAPILREREPSPKPLPWAPWIPRGVLVAWTSAGVAIVARRLRQGSGFRLGTMLLGLGGSAILAAAVTAAQLIPVWEFSSQSLRASDETHDYYHLSLEPARLAGLIWPNFYGDSFAHSRSWFEVLPPEKHARLWTPSLYLGGLTLVLAMGAFGFKNGPPGRAWMSAVAIFSMLACLGEYTSPLWWARWIPAVARAIGPHEPMFAGAIRGDSYLRDGDGGFYWLLATVLPGFGLFRFPTKLLTFSSLSIAALAGLGWDQLTADRRAWNRWAVRSSFLLALTLVGLAVTIADRARILAWFSAAGTGVLASPFGPFDAAGAYRELRFALAHGMAIFAVALLLALYGRRRPALAGALALIAATADLALANPRYVLTVPQRVMEAESRAVRIIEEAERIDPAEGPFRVHRLPFWTPPRWREGPSSGRLAEIAAWYRDTIAPKYGLTDGIQYTRTSGTTQLSAYEWFFTSIAVPATGEAARKLGVRSGEEVIYQTRRGFDLWGSRYFVLPASAYGWKDPDRAYAAFLDDAERIYPKPDAFNGAEGPAARDRWLRDEDVQVFRNRSAFPRAWVVHRARTHPPFPRLERSAGERVGTLEEILLANDPLWNEPRRTPFDPRKLAWIEAGAEQDLAAFLPGVDPAAAESATITHQSPQRVELEAVLERPGLVILADVFYPGWTLAIDGRPAPIRRANLMMRAAAVDAGKHHLVYTYEPRSFALGCRISAAGLAAFAGLAVSFRWMRNPTLP